VILGGIVQEHKNKIATVISNESQGPVNHSKAYDKYLPLINKKAEEEVEKFLKEEHAFNEYEKEVKRYQRLVKEITYNTHKVVRVGMFELHCEELIRALAKRAESLLNKLIDHMLNEHFEINKQ
jgi:dynein heavy chain